MFAIALIIALIFDAIVVFAAWRVLSRVDNTVVRWLAIGFAAIVVLFSIGVVSTTTTAVRTAIVMRAMSTQEPMASMIANDPEARRRLEAAVREGLTKEGGTLTGNVKDSVVAVVKPYMGYKLANAPDRFVLLSARSTLDMLNRARREGVATCTAVLNGDMSTMRRLGGADAAAEWLPDLMRADSLDRVEKASPAEVATFITQNAARTGVSSADMVAASRRQGAAACRMPIALIDDALRLPDPANARMLRGLGYGGSVATN